MSLIAVKIEQDLMRQNDQLKLALKGWQDWWEQHGIGTQKAADLWLVSEGKPLPPRPPAFVPGSPSYGIRVVDRAED